MAYHCVCTRVAQRVPLEEQELLSRPELTLCF